MNYLIHKNKSYYHPNNPGEAFQPMNIYLRDIEAKRSRLFPDRRRIPGRKTKYILAIAYLIHIYGVSRVIQAKKVYSTKADQQRQFNRIAAPFFQSIEDIQYTILKHRTDLIMIEAFKNLGGADYLAKQQRFHNQSIWIPASNQIQTDWQKSGTGRYAGDMTTYTYNKYFSGYDIQNI